MEYRREIDGLRAIAVLPVILYHAGFKVFEGGFIGVDVFFVISGYLITTIILSDMNKGQFSIVTFYERRARRILPALFFVMLCCLPFAWLWLLPNHLIDFGKSLIAVSAFSSNILFLRESGYFETAAELKPLLHTWSLAVEEQYYIFFPLLLMALWKLRKRFIFGSLMAVAFVSLAICQWGAYNKPLETFFLLPTRGWELAIGALISFYFLYKKDHTEFIQSNKFLSELFGLFGLALILYSIFVFDKSTPFPSLYALVPTIGTAFIIIFSKSDTVVGRFLSTKQMVGIGLISYSTYLWHQPLFVFARHRSLAEPSTILLLSLSVLSIILAYFSWRFVEMPFRDRKAINRKKIFCFAVAGSVFFATIGLAGNYKNGFDKRTNSKGVELADISNKTAINFGLSSDCDGRYTNNCRTSYNPEILLWGDSFAMHLEKGILASNPQAKVVQLTKSLCGPIFDVAPVNEQYTSSWADSCIDFNNNVRSWLKKKSTIKYVVISSSFFQYLGKEQFNLRFKLYNNGKIYDASKDVAAEKFIKTLDEIESMGITPIIISPPPQNGVNIGDCLVRAEFFGGDLSGCNFTRDNITDASNEISKFLKVIAEHHKVIFMDEIICDEGVCNASIDSTFIYRDVGHLSINGSAMLGKQMGFYDLIVGNK